MIDIGNNAIEKRNDNKLKLGGLKFMAHEASLKNVINGTHLKRGDASVN